MELSIKIFGQARSVLKTEKISIKINGGVSISEILQEVQKTYPEISYILETSKVAVNEEYKNLDYKVKENDRIAIIPPVGGG